MRLRPCFRGLCAALLLTPSLLGFQTLAAECPQGTLPSDGNRTIKGQTFLFPLLQRSAFVATYFGIGEGVVFQQINNIPFGNLGRQDVHAAGLQQDLNFAVVLTRWLALFADATGQALVGVNTQSLLLRTGQVTGQGQGGLLFRLFRSDTFGTQLAIRGYGGGGSYDRLSVLPLLQALDAMPVDTARTVLSGDLQKLLLVPGSRAQAGASFHWAQVIVPSLTFQATVAYEYQWATDHPFDVASGTRINVRRNGSNVSGAAALAFDAGQFGVPIALMGEYQAAWLNRSSEDDLSRTGTDHTLGAGIYYSGRRDLQLGIGGTTVLSGSRVTGIDANGVAAVSDKTRLYTGRLVLRYVW